MNVLLITFDLKSVGHDYEPFFVAIRGNAHQWWHFMSNLIIITTPHSVDDMSAKLTPLLTSQDSLLITHMGPENNGLLTEEAWRWINQVTGSSRTPTDPATPPRLRSLKELLGTTQE